MKYVVYSKEDEEFIFNCDDQSMLFESVKACKRGIKDVLDEPDSEDFDGKVCTPRTDGASERDFIIYRLLRVDK